MKSRQGARGLGNGALVTCAGMASFILTLALTLSLTWQLPILLRVIGNPYDQEAQREGGIDLPPCHTAPTITSYPNNLPPREENPVSYIDAPLPRKEYNFTVAICALVKDAEAYLAEWIDYHLVGLGFENIYLYDNSDAFELQRWYNQTLSHPLYSKVIVHHMPGNLLKDRNQFVQNAAYTDCIRDYGSDNAKGPQHAYFALIDVNEFLVLQQYPQNHSIIHDVLAEYLVPYGGALVMNWVLFGTANKTIYAPAPALKRFSFRDDASHGVVKTIVKASDFRAVRNPHAVLLRKQAGGSHKVSVRTTFTPGHVHEEQFGKTGASDKMRPSDVILVYHYRFLSIKEYTQKRCIRGEAIGNTKGCDRKTGKLSNSAPHHALHRPGVIYDTIAWDFLTSKVPKYRVYDHEEWQDYT